MVKKYINQEKTWVIDLCIIIAFIIISLAFTFGQVGTHFNEFLLSGSDAAHIASIAAALDNPQLFSNDSFLMNPSNFTHYNTIHIPLIRLLRQMLGNYSSPFALLIFPFTLLHLLGYYLLGNEILKNRFWAVIFSLIIFVPVHLNLGEIWGLIRDMIPRFLFQSLLPFLLTALIRWGKTQNHGRG